MNQITTLLFLAALCTLERDRQCPECPHGELDSGMGFGRRDLECCGFDEDDEDEDCGFAISYSITLYLDLIAA